MKRVIAVAFTLLLMLQPLALAAEPTLPPWRRELPGGREQATIVVGETVLNVDLALTPAETQLGLGYRNTLEPQDGMLFVFDDASPRTFWMKGMRFCLDIVWIEQGEVVGMAEDACPDPDGTPDPDRARFPSNAPVTYVLEVPGGWMRENGYGPGTKVDLSGISD